MKHLASTLICLLLIAGVHAQKEKIEIKKDTVLADGVPQFLMEKIHRGAGWFDFSVKELSGKEFCYVSTLRYVNPANPEASKNSGEVAYFEFKFLEWGLACETRCMPPVLAKGVAKELIKNKIVKNGMVDPEAVKRFCMINGTRYTEEQKRIGIFISR